MLPAKNRLNLSGRNHKGRVLTRRLESRDLLIRLEEANNFKAAVVVSKKVAKKATDRNRIRRLLTEALNEYIDKTSAHLVVYAKKNFADKKKEDVAKILKELLVNYV